MTNHHSFEINPDFKRLDRTNAILNAKIEDVYQSSYTTNLTLKTVISGRAVYRTRNSVYSIEPETCVIFNQGQRYDLEIQADTHTETLAIFFERGFAERAVAANAKNEQQLLEDPYPTSWSNRPFIETLQPFDNKTKKILKQVQSQLVNEPSGTSWLEDVFYDLASTLPSYNGQCVAAWTRIRSAKMSTKLELFRRLAFAKDYAHSCYHEELPVHKLAAIAKMSPFHFHRTFKSVFGITPAQFVQVRRLDVAYKLITAGNEAITDVCFDVGFSSLGSFSTLFRSYFGASPSQVQKRKKH